MKCYDYHNIAKLIEPNANIWLTSFMINPLKGKKTDILSSFEEFFTTLDTHLMSKTYYVMNKMAIAYYFLLFFVKHNIVNQCYLILSNTTYQVSGYNRYQVHQATYLEKLQYQIWAYSYDGIYYMSWYIYILHWGHAQTMWTI